MGNEGCEKTVSNPIQNISQLQKKWMESINFLNFRCLYDEPNEFIYLVNATLFISFAVKIVKYKYKISE